MISENTEMMYLKLFLFYFTNKMFTTFLIDIRENVPLQVNGKVLIYNDLNNIKK